MRQWTEESVVRVLTVRPPHLVNENHVCRMPFSLDMFRVPKVQPAPRGNLWHSDALRRYSRPRHEWRCQIKENKAAPPTDRVVWKSDRVVVVSTFVTALSDRSASLVSEDLSFFTSTVTQGILRWQRCAFYFALRPFDRSLGKTNEVAKPNSFEQRQKFPWWNYIGTSSGVALAKAIPCIAEGCGREF